MRISTTLTAATLGLCIAILSLTACSERTINATGPEDRGEYSVEVALSAVQFEQQATRFQAVGTGRANRSIALFPDSSGEVVERGFEAGQRVASGDLLLRLEDRDERLAVELATVRLRDAERLYARYQRAEDNAAILPTTIDAAALAVEAARIELARAKVTLDKRRVTAPFTGYVGISDVEVGNRVGVDSQIATLDDRASLLVRFEVPEAVSGQIQAGDQITVATWNNSAATRAATLADIGSRIDPQSRTFTVQARVDNTDDALRPGMSFRVMLDIFGGNYPVVPEVAVQWGANGAYVWQAVDDLAKQIPVSIVQRRAGKILIDAGLREGDRIVVEGVQRVRDGVRLRDASRLAEY